MTVLVFPSLVGQGWSVHKKPRFATRLAAHATGRETRARQYARPLWDFELTFDGLDMTAAGTYGSLGALSMQNLAGFFMLCQGRANPFLYIDPSDHAVIGQPIGTGDGVTTAFTMIRTIGGYNEPVGAVISIGTVYLNGSPTSAWVASQPNILTFNSPPGAGVAITADFDYGFACRFADDVEDFEEFMAMLSAVKTLKFQGVRDVLPIPPSLIVEIFTSNATWTAPSNLSQVVAIEGIGGGGGGSGSGSGPDQSSGGGGGGGYAIANQSNSAAALAVITPGSAHTIIAGAGGAGGAPGAIGGDGGDSSFDSIMIARGGFGAKVAPNPGAGGGRATFLNIPAAGSAVGGSGASGTYAPLAIQSGGGGGGGAAGPNGGGGFGGGGSEYDATFPFSYYGGGGGGGGGADGGVVGATAPQPSTGTDPLVGVGAAGGAAGNGTPGGAGGANGGPGGPGANGSGGGGGGLGGAGANGGAGAPIWIPSGGFAGTSGGPGGGGGAGGVSGGASANGGVWGGGGAGAWKSSGGGGNGAAGAVKISYKVSFP